MQRFGRSRLPALETAELSATGLASAAVGTAIDLPRPAHRTQITHGAAAPARADLQRRVRAGRADVRAAAGASGSACRARRCGSRSPSSSTRACCAGCRAAATSCASSPRPTCATRSSCAACSRARRRGSPPSAARRRASCARCARSTRRSTKLVHRADYESFERYLHLNERFHARLLKLARSPLLERALGAGSCRCRSPGPARSCWPRPSCRPRATS